VALLEQPSEKALLETHGGVIAALPPENHNSNTSELSAVVVMLVGVSVVPDAP
jgi:hypothetical protein